MHDLTPDVRGDEGAAVVDGRVGAGELDRGDEQVALADGEVHPVPDAPVRLLRVAHRGVEFLLPCARRHPSGGLTGEVYAGKIAEAEPLVEAGQPVLVVGSLPDPVRHLVEELVVGVLDGLDEVLGTMRSEVRVVGAVLAPALPATPIRARRLPALTCVGDGSVGVYDTDGEARQPCEWLEGRGRRLAAGYRSVGERVARGLRVQVLEGLHLSGARDAAHEELRVEVRTAGKRQYLAVARVYRYDGASGPGVARALGALDGGIELVLSEPLQVEVHGEVEVLARHGVLDTVGQLIAGIHRDRLAVLVHEPAQGVDPATVRHYPPERVHLVHLLAGLAAQHLLVVELDPALSDDRVIGEVLEGVELELLLGDRAGVPENVSGRLPRRVVADVVVVHDDTGELLGALHDVGDAVAVGVLLDKHRAVLGAPVEGRVVAVEHGLRVGPEDLGQLLDFLARDVRRGHGDVEAGDVVREDLAVAVADDTALGWVLDLEGLGRLRGDRVLGTREDLQVPQPGREDYEDHSHHDREGNHPDLHVALGHGRRVGPLLRGPRLLLLAHGKPDQLLSPCAIGGSGPSTLSAWTIRRRE